MIEWLVDGWFPILELALSIGNASSGGRRGKGRRGNEAPVGGNAALGVGDGTEWSFHGPFPGGKEDEDARRRARGAGNGSRSTGNVTRGIFEN